MNDLQQRLIKFAVAGIHLAKKKSERTQYFDISKQLIRSISSVGANYAEAQSASSHRDFHNKIRRSLKEAQETRYWLALYYELEPGDTSIKEILNECVELVKILSSIALKTKGHNTH